MIYRGVYKALLQSGGGESLYSKHVKGEDRDSSVGIATRYWLDGPGSESRWWRDFPHPSRLTLGPTQPPIKGIPIVFPGVKRPGCGFDHPPLLAPTSKKD